MDKLTENLFNKTMNIHIEYLKLLSQITITNTIDNHLKIEIEKTDIKYHTLLELILDNNLGKDFIWYEYINN